AVHRWHFRARPAPELLTQHPLAIRAQLLAQRPEVHGVGRAERLHAGLLQPPADRLEIRLAVLLDQRLEERQAEHFALALVDARREEVVDVVAEDVALEERPAAV